MVLSEQKGIILEEQLRLRREHTDMATAARYQIAEDALAEDEKMVFRYLCACTPLSDYVEESTPETLLDYLRHGLFLYNTYPAVRGLPEDIFLEYVLQPRVNNERMEPCRSLLYRSLPDALKGIEGVEAVLAANYWCCEEASYTVSDERTAPPLTIIRSAKGRCGEESTFAVHVLRSVGIPARQVYVPRWAHCDDNHAWVEVWCGGQWFYFGACEPEEVLNRGWFTQSAARAMQVYSRIFGPPADEDSVADRFGCTYRIKLLPHYAESKAVSVTVLENGSSVSGADVDFELVNYAELCPIASLKTDSAGRAELSCGYGSLHIRAFCGSRSAVCVLGPEESSCTLVLSENQEKDVWRYFDMEAPAIRPGVGNMPSSELLLVGEERLANANAKREAKIAAFFKPEQARAVLCRSACPEKLEALLHKSCGNLEQIIGFLSDEEPVYEYSAEELFSYRERMLASMCEKDLYDASRELLSDHFRAAMRFAREFEPDIFDEGVLCPRIELEELTSWRQALSALITPEQSDSFRKDPKVIWSYIEKNIRTIPELGYPTLVTAPVSCWKSATGCDRSRRILFIAICRTLGVAAKLRHTDKVPLYYQDGAYHAVPESSVHGAELVIKGGCTQWSYRANWTLSRREHGRYNTLKLEKSAWDGDQMTIPLKGGSYRLICTNRLPSGKQLVGILYFDLSDREKKQIEMEQRKPEISQLLQQIGLPEFSLLENGNISSEQGSGMYFWLDPGAEPTEHILNELYELRDAFAPLADKMAFILPDIMKIADDKLLQKTADALPGIRVAYDPMRRNGKLLARRMFMEPDALPFVLMTGKTGEGVYAVCGYNVGTAEMVQKLWNLVYDKRR